MVGPKAMCCEVLGVASCSSAGFKATCLWGRVPHVTYMLLKENVAGQLDPNKPPSHSHHQKADAWWTSHQWIEWTSPTFSDQSIQAPWVSRRAWRTCRSPSPDSWKGRNQQMMWGSTWEGHPGRKILTDTGHLPKQETQTVPVMYCSKYVLDMLRSPRIGRKQPKSKA